MCRVSQNPMILGVRYQHRVRFIVVLNAEVLRTIELDLVGRTISQYRACRPGPGYRVNPPVRAVGHPERVSASLENEHKAVPGRRDSPRIDEQRLRGDSPAARHTLQPAPGLRHHNPPLHVAPAAAAPP